jgi:type IV pilus assembly protein PilO
MLGTYHQFGTFISGVASLPRVVILTMHDVSLRPAKAGPNAPSKAGGLLSLEGTVKTYRYVDDEEAAAAQSAANQKKGGKKPAPPRKKEAKGA